MNIAPSEHPDSVLCDPQNRYYWETMNDSVEQSAIYESVFFSAIDEEDHAIVLTSQCDIQRSTSEEYVLVSRVITLEEFILHYLRLSGYTDEEALGQVAVRNTQKKRRAVIGKLMSDYMNNNTFQYFFIPPFSADADPSMITFDVTQCIGIGELATHRKCAVLRSPFREAIPSHYSAYIGRIGIPAIHDDYLRSVVENSCKIVDPQ